MQAAPLRNRDLVAAPALDSGVVAREPEVVAEYQSERLVGLLGVRVEDVLGRRGVVVFRIVDRSEAVELLRTDLQREERIDLAAGAEVLQRVVSALAVGDVDRVRLFEDELAVDLE